HMLIPPRSIRVEELRTERDGLRTLAADLPLVKNLVGTGAAWPPRWGGIAALAIVKRDQYRRHALSRMRVCHHEHGTLIWSGTPGCCQKKRCTRRNGKRFTTMDDSWHRYLPNILRPRRSPPNRPYVVKPAGSRSRTRIVIPCLVPTSLGRAQPA